MTDTMLAARLNFGTHALTVKEVPVPTPGPGEVRVKVMAAGVCASDVHLIGGSLRPLYLRGNEVTLGHEVAGVVDALGPGVGGVAEGARVVIQAGREGLPGTQQATLGVDYDGGWAQYVITTAPTVVPIPDSLPFEQAAIIPDAVTTPWGAIAWTGKVRHGESAGVWGVGGLGAHAVQLLRYVGAAPIVAIDPRLVARERALRLGADVALDPGQADFAARLGDWLGLRGLNVAFDFAGVPEVRAQAISCLGIGGRLVVVGIAGAPLTIPVDTAFCFTRRQVLGHWGYEPALVADLVRLVELGRLDFSGSVTRTYPLTEAAQAVHDLEHKVGDPIRLVLLPS